MATNAIEIRLAHLEGAFEQVDKRLGAIEARLDAQPVRMDARFDALMAWTDARFSAAQSRTDERFRELERKIDSVFSRLVMFTLGTGVSVILVILGALFTRR